MVLLILPKELSLSEIMKKKGGVHTRGSKKLRFKPSTGLNASIALLQWFPNIFYHPPVSVKYFRTHICNTCMIVLIS